MKVWILALAAFAAGPAFAGEHSVSQKGKAFTPGALAIKKGDSVSFVNDDTVAHNVFSRSEGATFNLKMQKPGESASVTFDAPGEHRVRCAIHPTMEMKVTVSD